MTTVTDKYRSTTDKNKTQLTQLITSTKKEINENERKGKKETNENNYKATETKQKSQQRNKANTERIHQCKAKKKTRRKNL